LRVLLAVSIALFAGCIDDLPLEWDLDYTRIVAVRAEPPGIVSGEVSTITSLIANEGAPALELPPEGAVVVAPMSLASSLVATNGQWTVTVPDEAALQAARTELGLMPGAPVPLSVGVSYQAGSLLAVKTVYLGETRTNPSIDSATINGEPLRDKTELVIDAAVETRLFVEAVLEDDINWLTSVGTMSDYDLPTSAYIKVDDDDRLEGEFALVFRDARGGVTWRVWPMRAEGTPMPAL
jgi:hypothetical protein